MNNLCKTKDVKENDDRQDKSGQFIQRFPGQIPGQVFKSPFSYHALSCINTYMGKNIRYRILGM